MSIVGFGLDFIGFGLFPPDFGYPTSSLLKAKPFPLMNINENSNETKEQNYFERAFKKIVTEKTVLVLPINSKPSYWESYAQFD